MRIAVYYNLAFGGAKRVVMEHIKGLKKKGHSIDLYTLDFEKDSFDPSPFSDNVYKYKFLYSQDPFPIIGRVVNDYKIFFVLKSLHQKIAQDIDNGRYDVVLVHPDKLTQAPFLLQFLKTPSVYYCQEPLRIVYEYSLRLKTHVGFFKRAYEEITRLYRKHIDRENVRISTQTVASCLHIRERMIEAYDVYPKINYCGVDEHTFYPMNIEKKNELFFLGSTTHFLDGYDLAQKAIQLIPSRMRPKLRIISWIDENKKRLTDYELTQIYNQSIATLCLSRFETFGLAPLESMASGTPVIATNISGHRETVADGKTGFLVDFSEKEISEKIITLINNPLKSKKMGLEARKHILENWTWGKCINTLESILQEDISTNNT